MYSNSHNKDWYRYKELSKMILKTGVPRHCLYRESLQIVTFITGAVWVVLSWQLKETEKFPTTADVHKFLKYR